MINSLKTLKLHFLLWAVGLLPLAFCLWPNHITRTIASIKTYLKFYEDFYKTEVSFHMFLMSKKYILNFFEYEIRNTYFLDGSREFTVALQTMRSFISSASSPVVAAPVSLLSWLTYVIFGQPMPCCPWVGSHSIR